MIFRYIPGATEELSGRAGFVNINSTVNSNRLRDFSARASYWSSVAASSIDSFIVLFNGIECISNSEIRAMYSYSLRCLAHGTAG